MELVECALSICTTIFHMAENVKANKERCQRVAQRVKAIQELVLTIKQRGPGQISITVENALRDLCGTLTSAKALMMKYSQNKAVVNFLKSSSHVDKFSKINERLTDNFQVLCGALQVEQGHILYKVFETVSGRRQDEVYLSGEGSSTALMPQPSTMPPMPVSSPTAPMPLSSPMPLIPASMPSAPRPDYSIISPMPTSMPSAPRPGYSIISPMPTSMPSAPRPGYSIISPMPTSMPSAPRPGYSIISPMPMSMPSAPMPLRGLMNPTPFSTSVVSNPVFATQTPAVISPTMAPMTVLRTTAPGGTPVMFPTQSPPVRSYVVNNSYFH